MEKTPRRDPEQGLAVLLVLIATALTPAVVAIAVLGFVEQWLVMAGAFAVAVCALVSVMGVIKRMLD